MRTHAIALILGLLVLCSCKGKCLEMSDVVSIGGCDRDGWCGVRLRNGETQKYVSHPVEGMQVCVRYEE